MKYQNSKYNIAEINLHAEFTLCYEARFHVYCLGPCRKAPYSYPIVFFLINGFKKIRILKLILKTIQRKIVKNLRHLICAHSAISGRSACSNCCELREI